MPSRKTYYDLLGVTPEAPPEVIRGAYKALAAKHHPDHNAGNPEAAKFLEQLNIAYDVLSDSLRRRDYDATLAVDPPPRSRAESRPAPPPPTDFEVAASVNSRSSVLVSFLAGALEFLGSLVVLLLSRRHGFLRMMIYLGGLLIFMVGWQVWHSLFPPPGTAGQEADNVAAETQPPDSPAETPAVPFTPRFVAPGIRQMGRGADSRFEVHTESGPTMVYRTLADATAARDEIVSRELVQRVRSTLEQLERELSEIRDPHVATASLPSLESQVSTLDRLIVEAQRIPLDRKVQLPPLFADAHDMLRAELAEIQDAPEVLRVLKPLLISLGVSLEVGFGETQLWLIASEIPEFEGDLPKITRLHSLLDLAYGPTPPRMMVFYQDRPLGEIPEEQFVTAGHRQELQRDIALRETARDRGAFAPKLARRTQLTTPADLEAGELIGSLHPERVDRSQLRPLIDSVLRDSTPR